MARWSTGAVVLLSLALALGVSSQGNTTCPAISAGGSSPVLPGYEFGNYSLFGPPYDSGAYGTLAFPFGPDGIADVMAQQREFGVARMGNIQAFGSVAQNQIGSCGSLANALGPDSDCITSLEDFQKFYNAAPEASQPALANFSDSDAAFARMRITVGPMLLQQVNGSLPFDPSTITGLDDIIANTEMSLDQLIAAGRVYMIDTAFLQPVLDPAPNSFVEFPTVVFFVDGPDPETGAEEQFMPLAIKFNTYNNNTYSPKDNRADWLLAKAFYNALDTSIHAAVHFLNNHFILENVCISAMRNLPDTHPLYALITKPCQRNAGVIGDGLAILLPETIGVFDNLLAVSGPSVATSIPVLFDMYNWEDQYLDTWAANRGLDAIPGFAYKEDTEALFNALNKYAGAIVNATYADSDAITADAQLQATLDALSSGDVGTIPGFPKAADVITTEALTRVLTQIMWLGGAQHHALNTLKVQNYDAVFPAAPGRIWAAPPAEKGVLTEQELLDTYILPTKVPMNYGWATFIDTTPPGYAPYINDSDRPQPDPALAAALGALQNGGGALGFEVDPNAATRVQFVLASQLMGANFGFLSIEEDMWPAAYGSSPGEACPGGEASTQLLSDLQEISANIQKREAALYGKLPQFLMLDPAHLPYFTYT